MLEYQLISRSYQVLMELDVQLQEKMALISLLEMEVQLTTVLTCGSLHKTSIMLLK